MIPLQRLRSQRQNRHREPEPNQNLEGKVMAQMRHRNSTVAAGYLPTLQRGATHPSFPRPPVFAEAATGKPIPLGQA